MIIWGIDPGLLSGFVSVELEEDGTVVPFAWSEDTVEQLYRKTSLGLSSAVDIVVCETFKPRGGAIAFKPYSLELIGWIRGLCLLRNVKLVMQDPVMKGGIWHETAMKQHPTVGRGGKGHARDAMAHVLCYVQRCSPLALSPLAPSGGTE